MRFRALFARVASAVLCDQALVGLAFAAIEPRQACSIGPGFAGSILRTSAHDDAAPGAKTGQRGMITGTQVTDTQTILATNSCGEVHLGSPAGGGDSRQFPVLPGGIGNGTSTRTVRRQLRPQSGAECRRQAALRALLASNEKLVTMPTLALKAGQPVWRLAAT